MSHKKFYIDTEGNDDLAYIEAMKKASELANADPEIKRVVLFIYTKKVTGWFDRIMGEKTVKALHKGTKIDGLKPLYKFETIKTYSDGFSKSDIVIICGLESDKVFPIDDYYSAKYIIAVPWLKDGLQDWVKTWGATELRGKELAQYDDPSCIIIKALSGLTKAVNMSTALSHHSDIELAKTYILALHKYNEPLNSHLIRAYLVSKLSWETGQAKQFTDLIDMINNGGYFKGGEKSNLEFHYKNWQKQCIEQIAQ